MSAEKDAISVRWPAFSDAMPANFRRMRIENTLIDIIIAVENKKIPAHSLLLASASKYFYNLMNSLVTSTGNPTILALAEVEYDEMVQIVELIYSGYVDVPKKNWSKFIAAAKLLKINGFEKIGNVNPLSIEKEFEMRNCYVKVVDIKNMNLASGSTKEAAGPVNTPPNSEPGSPSNSSSETANTSSDEAPNSPKKTSVAESGTSKGASSAMPSTSKAATTGLQSTANTNTSKAAPNTKPIMTKLPSLADSVTVNTPPYPLPGTPNSRAPSADIAMDDFAETASPDDVRTRASKRSSKGDAKAIPPKKNRKVVLMSDDSSDSDAPLARVPARVPARVLAPRKSATATDDKQTPSTRPIVSLSAGNTCEYCGVSYSRRDHLKDHLMNEHIKNLKLF